MEKIRFAQDWFFMRQVLRFGGLEFRVWVLRVGGPETIIGFRGLGFRVV